MVLRSRDKQCIKWAKIVKGELFKILSPAARLLTFKNPEKEEKEANKVTEYWNGNHLELEFDPVYLQPNNKRSYKKSKYNNEKNSQSYSQVLQSNKTTNTIQQQYPANDNSTLALVRNHQTAAISEM